MSIELQRIRSLLSPFYQQLEELGESDPQVLMITLCGVAAAVQPASFSECIEADTDKQWDSLAKALCLQGFDKVAANRFISEFRALPRDLSKSIVDLVSVAVPPSPDLAEVLLEGVHQRRSTRKSYCIPSGLAKTICHIGLGFHINPINAVCEGANADMLAIQSAQWVETTYGLYGVQLGASRKQCLRHASGDSYQIDHQPVATGGSNDPEEFHAGFLSDFSGHVFSSKRGGDNEKIPGRSVLRSEVQRLPELLRKVDGRVVAVVPVSWLLRTVGEDASYKQVLVNRGQIEAVVHLPEKSITGINQSFALLVLNTAKYSKTIKFIDATGDTYTELDSSGAVSFSEQGRNELLGMIGGYKDSGDMAAINMEEVLLDGGSLDPQKHVRYATEMFSTGRMYESMPLEEMVDIIQCQAIRPVGEKTVVCVDDPNVEAPELELGPSSIDVYGFLRVGNEAKQLNPHFAAAKRVERQRLRTSDIVLTVKGRVGVSGYVDDDAANCLGNQSFVILRLKEGKKKIDSRVLHHFLRSDHFLNLLKSRVRRSTVLTLTAADLRQLPIPNLGPGQAARVIASWERIVESVSRIRELENAISRELSESWSDTKANDE